MIPEKINKEIENAFISRLKTKYHLVYTHYDDDLNQSAKVIHHCMEAQDLYPIYEILDDWISDSQYDVSLQIIYELRDEILNDCKYSKIHEYMEEWIESADNIDHLRFLIMERDNSDPVREIIGRTRLRARVTQFSNFDCLPSNWDMRNTYLYVDYFKDIIDILCLNPAVVKQTFIKTGINAVGKFPNLAYRNGKEAVDYTEFAQEVHNQCCYCHLVFMGMLPLSSMYDNDFKKHKSIVIPKGNSCGFYSWWNGGGSLLSMTLKRDLVLPLKIPRKTEYDRFELDVDERNCGLGYCIDDAYGLIREAWGKEFQLIYN